MHTDGLANLLHVDLSSNSQRIEQSIHEKLGHNCYLIRAVYVLNFLLGSNGPHPNQVDVHPQPIYMKHI